MSDDQLKLIYDNSVRTQDVARKTCQKRWMIETDGVRELGKSVRAARDDNDDICILQVRGAFNKFPDFFVQAFKIVVDS